MGATVTMKTTMMLANMMEETVAKTPWKTGITTARIVRVCVVERNIGSRIITVMMKTTMLLATSMVVIVVIILHQAGICTAKTASALLELKSNETTSKGTRWNQ